MTRRVLWAVSGMGSLILLAPKDCLRGERIPGPDESSCSSLAGVHWASRTTAYVVMAAIALAVIVVITLLGRRSAVRRRR